MSGREPDVTSARAAAAVGSGALVELAEETSEATAGQVAVIEGQPRSQWQLFRRRFLKHKLAVLSLVLLFVLFLLAVFAPVVAPYELDPTLTFEVLRGGRKGPSAEHWFGTDELGRDQVTRVLYAGRISLAVGLGVAVVSSTLGTMIGALAGYYGKWVDQLLMRMTDLVLVVPALAVLLMASSKVGQSVPAMILVLSGLFWMTIARVVRGVFLSLKEKEFVEAARATGASTWRIISRHLLPNTIGPIVVNTTLVVGLAILTESTLSFLGFGIQPPTVTWGNMLAQSQATVGTRLSYLIYPPGVAILLTVLAVNYLGDGLRDALDPQSGR